MTINTDSTDKAPLVSDDAAGSTVQVAEPAIPISSDWRRVLRRLLHDKAAVAGLIILAMFALFAVFAPAIAPYDPLKTSMNELRLLPSWKHILGTDELGRDVFSRIVFGARVSVTVSAAVVALSLVPGMILGLLAGYHGGALDSVMMRVMDAFQSIPGLILALAVASTLGAGLMNAIYALAILFIPPFVRVTRASTLAVREATFIEASRSIGTPTRRILFRRVVPSVLSPVIVFATIAAGSTLLAEAALSYLGLGQLPPEPSWGSMLKTSYDTVFQSTWLILPAGITIALAVLAFNFVGDGLRDALGVDNSVELKREYHREARRAGRGITPVVRGDSGPEPVKQGEGATPPLLDIRDLTVEFAGQSGDVVIVDDINLHIGSGEILGLVGESGSGKSVTALAIMRLLPSPQARITSGAIRLEGRDLLSLKADAVRKFRGNDISMVFQDPMSSLNPLFTVGNQIIEALRLHQRMSRAAARTRAIAALGEVGIPHPERRIDDYPHQFSGGMRQRVMIAMALITEPKLVIADEPTTALDVTIQAQILDLMRSLSRERGTSFLFVTHDMGVVAELCDRVAVMYAGQIVEQASVDELFANPRHPYTRALLEAIPDPEHLHGNELRTIPGRVPAPGSRPVGCRFRARCNFATDDCAEAPIAMETILGTEVRCIHAKSLSPEAEMVR